MGEAGTADFTVKLASKPTANVTVTVTSGDTTAATITQGASLSFNTNNWDSTQPVRVAGVDDSDPDNETFDISLAATGGDYEGKTGSVAVSVTDDDTPNLAIDPTALSVLEGGTGEFTVKLTTLPTADVTVTVTSDDTGAATVSDATLTFTTTTWEDEQTITVIGIDDNDGVNETVSISLSATGGDYAGKTGSVAVSVTDDELLTGLVLKDPEYNTVTLNPAFDSGTTGYTASVGQFVSELTVTPTKGNSSSDLEFLDREGTTLDDADTAAGHQVSLEVGKTTFSVKVTSSDSSVTRTYTIVVERGTEVTLVSNTGATAFGSNFNMGRNTRDQYRFEFTTGPNETGYTLGRFGLFIDTEEFGFGENCDTRIYEANPSFSRGTEIVELLSPHRTAYTNNSVNYFTARAHHLLEPGTTYQFSADCNGNDFDNEFLIKTTTSHDETGETGWSIADGYRHSGKVLHSGRVMMGEVLGYVNPPDPGINLSKTATTILEGNTDTYEVSLKTPPTDTVTVDISVPEGSDASVSPTSLTFVTDEWDDPQTVTITTSDDADNLNDSVRITHDASGGNYEDVEDAYLDVTITDDDTPNFDISEPIIELEEDATSDTEFTVELTTLPTADVTVTVTSGNTAVVTVTQGSSLTFTDETWDEPQTIKIRAVQDEDAVSQGTDINLVGSGGGYDGVTGSVEVLVDDDETAEFVINPPSLTVGEAGTADFTVKLASKPLTNVTVTVTSGDSTAATITRGASLSFTTNNWDDEQPVTVSGVDDSDPDNETFDITLSASGGDYAGVTDTLALTVTDDDTPNLAIDPTTLTVTESGSAEFTVELTTLPTADVTVTVTSDDTGAATVSDSSLEFTTSDWNSPQTITVSGVDDDDGGNETVSISLAATGGDYEGKTGSVALSVTDDDLLTGLELEDSDGDAISLDPTFASSTVSYTVTVDNVIEEMTVTPTKGDSYSDLVYLDGTDQPLADSNTVEAGHQVSLGVGANIFKVKVTSSDMTETTTYTFVVTRLTHSTFVKNTHLTPDDILNIGSSQDGRNGQRFTTGNHAAGYEITSAGIYVDQVNYSPGETLTVRIHKFDGSTTNNLGDIVAALTTPTLTAGETNYFTAPAGTRLEAATQNIVNFHSTGDVHTDFSIGAVSSNTEVGASDWRIENAYRFQGNLQSGGGLSLMIEVRGNNVPLSDDATLSGLALTETSTPANTVALSPAFASTTTSYTATVDNHIEVITVTPTKGDVGASIEFLDGSDGALADAETNTSGQQVSLGVGANTFKVKVTSSDMNETETYTVVVTRLTDSTLVTNTHLTSTSTLNIGQDTNGELGQRFTTGSHADGYTLTTVGVYVSEANFSGGETVTVRIHEWDSSATNDLGTLVATLTTPMLADDEVNFFDAPSGTTLDPDTRYIVNFHSTGNASSDLEITRVSSNEQGGAEGWLIEDTSRFAGNPAGSGNSLQIEVRGNAISAADSLTALVLTDSDSNTVALSPTFASAILSYTAAVDNDIEEITVTPTKNDESATIEYLDASNEALEDSDSVTDGYQVSLDEGENTFKVKVTSEDMVDTTTYTVIVTRHRAPPLVGLEGNLNTTVEEPAGSGDDFTVNVGVELDYAYHLDISINYSFEHVSTEAADVSGSLSGTLTIPAGQTRGDIALVVVDDNIVETAEAIKVVVSKGAYEGNLAPAQAQVQITDMDTATFGIQAIASVEEGSALTIVMQGNAPVDTDFEVDVETVASTASNAATVTDDYPSEDDTLWFRNKSQQESWTITLPDDDIAEDDEVFQIRISPTDPLPARVSLSPTLQTVTITDNEVIELAIAPTSLTILESGSGTFTVKLRSKPSANVTVTVTSDDTGAATVSDDSLTFTTTTWNDEQTITVSGVDDSDRNTETFDVSLSASGGGYNGVKGTLAMIVTDDDDPNLVVNPPSFTIDEGSTETFRVKLATLPTADVTVTVTSDDTGAATVSDGSLEFTTSTWDTYQPITVTGVQDADAADEPVTITLVANGGDYVNVRATVSVTVDDTEVADLMIEETSLEIDEGGKPVDGHAVIQLRQLAERADRHGERRAGR